MAKISSTVHLEDSTWQEIKEYQNKYKCSRNEAIERMFVERRLLLKISCKSATEAPKKFEEKVKDDLDAVLDDIYSDMPE